MQITERSRLVVLALASVALAACATDSTPTTPQLGATVATASRVDDERATGAAYTETNDAAGNAILAFRRAADGSLTPLATVSTGGLGAGGTTDPLASQFALVLRGDHRVLYAVN